MKIQIFGKLHSINVEEALFALGYTCMKIAIKNETYSARVQNALFKLGFTWSGGVAEVRYNNARVIYADTLRFRLTFDQTYNNWFASDNRVENVLDETSGLLIVKE